MKPFQIDSRPVHKGGSANALSLWYKPLEYKVQCEWGYLLFHNSPKCKHQHLSVNTDGNLGATGRKFGLSIQPCCYFWVFLSGEINRAGSWAHGKLLRSSASCGRDPEGGHWGRVGTRPEAAAVQEGLVGWWSDPPPTSDGFWGFPMGFWGYSCDSTPDSNGEMAATTR